MVCSKMPGLCSLGNLWRVEDRTADFLGSRFEFCGPIDKYMSSLFILPRILDVRSRDKIPDK